MSGPSVLWPDNIPWMTASEWGAVGASHHGQEFNFGVQWGANQNIRVTYSPSTVAGQEGTGRLYAYNPDGDRYTVLAACVAADRVEAAWQDMRSRESLVGGDVTDWTKMLDDTPVTDLIVVHYLVTPTSDRGIRPVWRTLSGVDVDEALAGVARLREAVAQDGGRIRVTAVSQGEQSIPVTRREDPAPPAGDYLTTGRSVEVEL